MNTPRRALVTLLCALAASACSAPVAHRFPLREPVWRDTDLDPVSVPCRPNPKDPSKRLCMPEPYESSFAWDAADNTIFRPVSRFWAVDPAKEAVNVNSMDETPDSSWYMNRIGRFPMTPEQVYRGACDDTDVLDTEAPDGSWLIDQGKMNGYNPGFRIKFRGTKYMLKADPPDQPERATGATVIASRLYHAAGWWVPCERVVYFRRSVLRLSPGLTVTDNSGVTRPFDDRALDELLKGASRRGELIRMVASQWVPGRVLGPFRYEGVRNDDPNDVIPHEDRRDLRGARVLAAWLNHFDSREQNTLTTWISASSTDLDSSPGHVRHWYLDLGDCFGSEWAWDEISRRLGHAHYLDFGYMAEDFVTLGAIRRPWDRTERSRQGAIFGYFHSRDFDPDLWRGGYPNPAFARMSDRDGAWAARVIARLTPEHVEAAVQAGNYTAAAHREFLTQQLLIRQRAILERYLSKLSALADPRIDDGSSLCVTDLARLRSSVARASAPDYRVRVYAGSPLRPRPAPPSEARDASSYCTRLAHEPVPISEPDGSGRRYMVVDIGEASAPAPLRTHLYDLGPKNGFRVVGLERPTSWASVTE